MGLPIHSSISEYTKVLSSHRFKDKYTNGDLAHKYWEGGDFWKQRNCYVHLFAKDDTHVDIIEITIPTDNCKSPNEYINIVNELLTDMSSKYGSCVCDTLDIEKESDIFFHPVWHREDLYYLYTWNKPNGDLKILINTESIYAIFVQYKSIQYINWNKEASRFKGQGSSDL